MKILTYISIQSFFFHIFVSAQINSGESEFDTLNDDSGMELPFIILHQNASSYGFDIKPTANPFFSQPLQKVGDSTEYKQINVEGGASKEILTLKKTIISNPDNSMSLREESYNHQSGVTIEEIKDFDTLDESQIREELEVFISSFTSELQSDSIPINWKETGNDSMKNFSENQWDSNTNAQITMSGAGYFEYTQPIMVRMPVNIDILLNFQYSGQKAVDTPWGVKDTLLLTGDILVNFEIPTFYLNNNGFSALPLNNAVKYNRISFGFEAFLNAYYIEGMPYMTNSIFQSDSLVGKKWVIEYQNETTFFDLDSLFNLGKKDQEVLTDFNRWFKSGDIGNAQPSIPLLNSWTWNGAFPWVYNHETASWFYYHFAGNTCNAYDARNGNWFTFNGTSNSWVKSN